MAKGSLQGPFCLLSFRSINRLKFGFLRLFWQSQVNVRVYCTMTIKKVLPGLVVLSLSVVFALLFYKQSPGYNLLIFSLLFAIGFGLAKPNLLNHHWIKILLFSIIFTSACWVWQAQYISLWGLLFSYALLISFSVSPQIKNALYAGLQIPLSMLYQMADALSYRWGRSRIGKRISFLWLIPVSLIVVFAFLYAGGSEFFAEWFATFANTLGDWLEAFLGKLDLLFVVYLIFGAVIASVMLLQERKTTLAQLDDISSDELQRVRKRFKGNPLSLKREYHTALVSIISLNVLLLFVLFLEIKHVWFGFEWQGEMLKSMVHKGTWSLIFSIVLSIAISAWFFRRNLNFYPDNGRLKYLFSCWIALNLLMIVSVGVRNYWYIYYFALAYKRIGVYFFLVLCTFGLISLWIKIHKPRSNYFLLRLNTAFFIVSFLLMGLPNWQSIIAKHNMNHGHRSFIHVPFMLSLPDQALPWLLLSEDKVKQLDSLQTEQLPFRKEGYFEEYGYTNRVQKRAERYLKAWEKKPFLSKTWAGERTYRKLKELKQEGLIEH